MLSNNWLDKFAALKEQNTTTTKPHKTLYPKSSPPCVIPLNHRRLCGEINPVTAVK